MYKLIFIIIIFSGNIWADQDCESKNGKTVYINGSGVRLRSAPSTDSKIVAIPKYNWHYTSMCEAGEWSKLHAYNDDSIQYYSIQDKRVWVKTKFLTDNWTDIKVVSAKISAARRSKNSNELVLWMGRRLDMFDVNSFERFQFLKEYKYQLKKIKDKKSVDIVSKQIKNDRKKFFNTDQVCITHKGDDIFFLNGAGIRLRKESSRSSKSLKTLSFNELILCVQKIKGPWAQIVVNNAVYRENYYQSNHSETKKYVILDGHGATILGWVPRKFLTDHKIFLEAIKVKVADYKKKKKWKNAIGWAERAVDITPYGEASINALKELSTLFELSGKSEKVKIAQKKIKNYYNKLPVGLDLHQWFFQKFGTTSGVYQPFDTMMPNESDLRKLVMIIEKNSNSDISKEAKRVLTGIVYPLIKSNESEKQLYSESLMAKLYTDKFLDEVHVNNPGYKESEKKLKILMRVYNGPYSKFNFDRTIYPGLESSQTDKELLVETLRLNPGLFDIIKNDKLKKDADIHKAVVSGCSNSVVDNSYISHDRLSDFWEYAPLEFSKENASSLILCIEKDKVANFIKKVDIDDSTEDVMLILNYYKNRRLEKWHNPMQNASYKHDIDFFDKFYLALTRRVQKETDVINFFVDVHKLAGFWNVNGGSVPFNEFDREEVVEFLVQICKALPDIHSKMRGSYVNPNFIYLKNWQKIPNALFKKYEKVLTSCIPKSKK